MTTTILTIEFQIFWAKLAKDNWGTWPASESWPAIGCTYTAYQQEYNGGTGTFLKICGDTYLVRPISKRKPEGELVKLR